MPAFGSSSTLSAFKAKSSMYQKAINAINVLLLMCGIYMIGEASMLFKIYHLPKLGFWCHYFVWFPTTMLILGVYILVTALYSIGVACSYNSQELSYRVVVGFIAFLYTLSFIGTVFLIFCSLKLQNSIYYVPVMDSEVEDHLKLYGVDEKVTSDWDIMQTDLRCCGGLKMGNGYDDWRQAGYESWNPEGKNVPDSCCLPDEVLGYEQKDCGKGLIEDREARALRRAISEDIWQNGCIWVLQQKIKVDIGPRLWYVAGAGVVTILMELVTVVLASAYVATLNRRVKRTNTMELR